MLPCCSRSHRLRVGEVGDNDVQCAPAVMFEAQDPDATSGLCALVSVHVAVDHPTQLSSPCSQESFLTTLNGDNHTSDDQPDPAAGLLTCTAPMWAAQEQPGALLPQLMALEGLTCRLCMCQRTSSAGGTVAPRWGAQFRSSLFFCLTISNRPASNPQLIEETQKKACQNNIKYVHTELLELPPPVVQVLTACSNLTLCAGQGQGFASGAVPSLARFGHSEVYIAEGPFVACCVHCRCGRLCLESTPLVSVVCKCWMTQSWQHMPH